MLSSTRWQANPSRCKHAQDVPMREQGNVAVRGPSARNDLIHSSTHLPRRLASGTSIAENQPTRPFRLNLLGHQALIFPVVPLDQAWIDDGFGAEAHQVTSLPRPPQGTDKNERERLPGQHRPQPFGLSSSAVGQGDFGYAGVLPAQTPLGLPMPDQEYIHVQPSWLRRCLPLSIAALPRSPTVPISSR
jgi:hypothetical protein